MKEPREIHVISNTHWDREWLCDFRETRMMLVDFFDRLLSVYEKEPRYHSYLLDGQVVPVEDFLEVRPEKKEAILEAVKTGRLFIGPWYTDPEGFCVNGESLVRNLLYGHRVAREFGAVMKVGHTPFSYGQNSQMPQIYQGFGIDTMLFYHGVSHDDTPNEFIFEGADGSRVFASQMSAGARYNFYHNILRAVLFNEQINDREYTWNGTELPFHLCGEDRCMEHHFLLDPQIGFHEECIEAAFRKLRDVEAETGTTPYLAFMDGHDASVPTTATTRIIDLIQQYAGEDKVFHSSLPALMAKVKAAAKDLVVLKGERRIPKPMGARLHLYSDVLSCRTRLKRANAHAEITLQRFAEPYAALGWTLGADYPASSIDMAWKLLLRSHPHDSIAGTGVDDIERDQFHRLRQVTNIAKGLMRRGLEQIQLRIDNADGSPDDVLLTVFNPSPFPRTEVITAVLDLPPDKAAGGFHIVNAQTGAPVAAQFVTQQPYHVVVNHAENATAMMTCQRVRLHLDACEIPAMGYRVFRVMPKTAPVVPQSMIPGLNAMENEHLRVEIQQDGTLRLLQKETGKVFEGLHYFEDCGEAGHAWMHIEPAQDMILTSVGQPARIALLEDGPLLARYAVTYTLQIPVGLDENGGDPWQRLDGGPNASRRTRETEPFEITSVFTLRQGARALDVTTRFENRCKFHRLRVMFPTHLNTNVCSVESAFDVVERAIVFGPDSPWYGAAKPTFPMHRFVDVSDGKTGLAVVNDGLREYGVTDNADRAIAITLMRAFEIALTTVSKRWEHHPEMEQSQCPGQHEFTYAVYPHAGDWATGEVYRQAERIAVPMQPAQAGAHGGTLPKEYSFVQIAPANVIMSALKRAEDGAGMVIRLFNPTSKKIEGTATFGATPKSVEQIDLEEKTVGALPLTGNTVSVSLDSKKIVTLKITF